MMKKWMKLSLLGLTAMMLATGCSKAVDTKETTESTAPESTTGETATADQTQESTQAARPQKPASMGTVTLGAYKGLPVEVVKFTVTDEELESALLTILSPYGESKPDAPGPAKLGDTVNIDYAGYLNGVAFDGGTAEDTDLTLGANQFIDGFESGLVGVKKGDQVSLDLTFPENYGNPDLAGQAVVFEVKVNSIEAMELPTLDDAFVAEKFPEDGTVEKFKEGVTKALMDQKQYYSDVEKDNDLMLAVMEASQVEPSEEGIAYIYQLQMNQYEQTAAMYGMGIGDYVMMYYGMDEATFETELKNMAEMIVKQELVLTAIADAEKLEVTDEELLVLAQEFGYADKDEMFANETEEEAVTVVKMRKAMDLISDNAVVKEVDKKSADVGKDTMFEVDTKEE